LRLKLGIALLVLGLVMPAGTLVVAGMDWPGALKALVSGILLFGLEISGTSCGRCSSTKPGSCSLPRRIRKSYVHDLRASFPFGDQACPAGGPAALEKLADQELPRNVTYEWTELSYLQKQASKVEQFRDLRQNPFSAFVLGVVLVFFVLAGLYESWSLPLAVILVVPVCLLSALAGVLLAQMDINIFVQVGFVVLVGLAAKNAILIVEFARDRQQEGASRFDAAVEAARVRQRPIVMTSLAFILGVFPLVIAQGGGAEMRRTLGTAVFAGMLGVTLFGIFLTPVFFFVIGWLSGQGSPRVEASHKVSSVTASPGAAPECGGR
jgi:multidrug efflux pump subunit AcrB